MPTQPRKPKRSSIEINKDLPQLEDLLKGFERKISRMRILTEIGNALNSTLELEKLFELIIESVTRELRAGVSSLMIREADYLIVKAARGMSKKLMKKVRIRVGESVTGWVAEHAQPLLIGDITENKRFSRDGIRRRYKSNSFLSVPIIHKGEVLGVLNCTDKSDHGAFTEDDLEFMNLVASQAAVAIVNARMVDYIRNLADHDALTGLFNHRYFIDRASKEIERVDRYLNKSLSLVMIDIDFFKNINDTYGHQAGNKVLQSLANKIVEMTRRVDVICRYGGEEFVVILPEITSSKALIYVERVRKAVEKMKVKIDGKMVSITVSAGIADYPTNCADSKKLIGCADLALYQAKNDGRNCTRIYRADK